MLALAQEIEEDLPRIHSTVIISHCAAVSLSAPTHGRGGLRAGFPHTVGQAAHSAGHALPDRTPHTAH